MYNTRIKAWGIHKNSKAWEKEQASRMMGSNLTSSKFVKLDSGHEVPVHKITRWRKALAKRGASVASIPIPEEACCPTTNMTLGQGNLEFNERHRGHQQHCHSHPVPPLSEVRTIDSLEPLLKDMDNYYRSYFDHTCRTRTCRSREISRKVTGPARGHHPARLQNQYTVALTMMKESQRKTAFSLLHRVFDLATPMFQARDPELIASLLVMSQTDTQEFPEISCELWDHFSKLSGAVHGDSHPLTKLCQYLKRFRSRQLAIEQLSQ